MKTCKIKIDEHELKKIGFYKQWGSYYAYIDSNHVVTLEVNLKEQFVNIYDDKDFYIISNYIKKENL